ncbi:hypothetical protein [Stenoxybacter acetivorans]|uniref:hypothetical protein n=1 Tax=Stenoxybacter acetivorans TaxID=422441 RepID=UPI0005695438|nr:hypothetical protein [Stenoxybacter acetivorans]
MVISNRFSNIFEESAQKMILDLFIFNRETTEFSFNENELKKRNWDYAALNSTTFDQEYGDFERLIQSTFFNKKYYCLSLDQIKYDNYNFENSIVHIFDNIPEDWSEILLAFNEFTLWESVIFNTPPFNLFIIIPWSIGYNLLVGGESKLIRNICSGWLINEKYPISP